MAVPPPPPPSIAIGHRTDATPRIAGLHRPTMQAAPFASVPPAASQTLVRPGSHVMVAARSMVRLPVAQDVLASGADSARLSCNSLTAPALHPPTEQRLNPTGLPTQRKPEEAPSHIFVAHHGVRQRPPHQAPTPCDSQAPRRLTAMGLSSRPDASTPSWHQAPAPAPSTSSVARSLSPAVPFRTQKTKTQYSMSGFFAASALSPRGTRYVSPTTPRETQESGPVSANSTALWQQSPMQTLTLGSGEVTGVGEPLGSARGPGGACVEAGHLAWNGCQSPLPSPRRPSPRRLLAQDGHELCTGSLLAGTNDQEIKQVCLETQMQVGQLLGVLRGLESEVIELRRQNQELRGVVLRQGFHSQGGTRSSHDSSTEEFRYPGSSLPYLASLGSQVPFFAAGAASAKDPAMTLSPPGSPRPTSSAASSEQATIWPEDELGPGERVANDCVARSRPEEGQISGASSSTIDCETTCRTNAGHEVDKAAGQGTFSSVSGEAGRLTILEKLLEDLKASQGTTSFPRQPSSSNEECWNKLRQTLSESGAINELLGELRSKFTKQAPFATKPGPSKMHSTGSTVSTSDAGSGCGLAGPGGSGTATWDH